MADPVDNLRQASADGPGIKVLSPAAQAILDAFRTSHTGQGCLAAALRAVAEHCVPDDSEGYWVYIPRVLAIADELEGT